MEGVTIEPLDVEDIAGVMKRGAKIAQMALSAVASAGYRADDPSMLVGFVLAAHGLASGVGMPIGDFLGVVKEVTKVADEVVNGASPELVRQATEIAEGLMEEVNRKREERVVGAPIVPRSDKVH